MKINELITAENGIFATVFETQFSNLFATCFNGVTAQSLDTFLLFNYGERVCMPSITADNLQVFIRAVIDTNAVTWEQQAKTLNAEYNVINPVLSTTVTERTDTVAQTGSTNSEHTDQNFNDTEYTGGNKQTGESTQDRTQTGTTKTVVSGTGVNLSESIQKEYNLRQTNFAHKIVSQIVDSFTLKIY